MNCRFLSPVDEEEHEDNFDAASLHWPSRSLNFESLHDDVPFLAIQGGLEAIEEGTREGGFGGETGRGWTTARGEGGWWVIKLRGKVVSRYNNPQKPHKISILCDSQRVCVCVCVCERERERCWLTFYFPMLLSDRHRSEGDAEKARLAGECRRLRGGRQRRAVEAANEVLKSVVDAVLGGGVESVVGHSSEAADAPAPGDATVASASLEAAQQPGEGSTWEDRREAADSIRGLILARGDPECIEALCDALLEDTSWSVRAAAAASLSVVAPQGHPQAVTALSALVLGSGVGDVGPVDEEREGGDGAGGVAVAEARAEGARALAKLVSKRAERGDDKDVAAEGGRVGEEGGKGVVAVVGDGGGAEGTSAALQAFLSPFEAGGGTTDPFLMHALVQSLGSLMDGGIGVDAAGDALKTLSPQPSASQPTNPQPFMAVRERTLNLSWRSRTLNLSLRSRTLNPQTSTLCSKHQVKPSSR